MSDLSQLVTTTMTLPSVPFTSSIASTRQSLFVCSACLSKSLTLISSENRRRRSEKQQRYCHCALQPKPSDHTLQTRLFRPYHFRSRQIQVPLLQPYHQQSAPFSVLDRPPPKYNGHVPLTNTERGVLAFGSALTALLDPRRHGSFHSSSLSPPQPANHTHVQTWSPPFPKQQPRSLSSVPSATRSSPRPPADASYAIAL